MKTVAEIVKMPSSRVTTKELHREIEIIKDNHLAHIHDCIHRLEEDVKDNRKFFTQRLDRLDNQHMVDIGYNSYIINQRVSSTIWGCVTHTFALCATIGVKVCQ